MREQLRDIAFERIAAVDGTKIPPTIKGLTRFELACLESHQIAWRQFLGGADEHACFLEDDLHIRPDFEALIGMTAWIPADAHSVKLDTYLQKVKLGEARAAPGGREIARLYTRHESSAAYLLSRDGAKRYLELTANPIAPADYSLFPKSSAPPGFAHLSAHARGRDPGSSSPGRGGRSRVPDRDGEQRRHPPANHQKALARDQAACFPGRKLEGGDLRCGRPETGDDDGCSSLGRRLWEPVRPSRARLATTPAFQCLRRQNLSHCNPQAPCFPGR